MIRPLQKFTTQHNKELILMLIRLRFARVSIEIRHNVRDFRQQQKLIEKILLSPETFEIYKHTQYKSIISPSLLYATKV